jgi:hypothetical protein
MIGYCLPALALSITLVLTGVFGAATPGLAQVPAIDIDVFYIDPGDPGGSTAQDRGDTAASFDGNVASFSYLTASGTTAPQRIGIDLAIETDVSRLRVSKRSDVDGLGDPVDHVDLQLLFTSDSGPLEQRSYLPVTGLTNGYSGGELIDAVAVNPADATVDDDMHDFDTFGWYSLTFDTTPATGIALEFVRDPDDDVDFNHYATNEFELYHGNSPKTIVGHQLFSAAQPGVIASNTRLDVGNVIDGDVDTSSFLTPSGTTWPNTVAVDLGQPWLVGRIRVAKEGDTDGIGGIDNMDLEILVSVDSGPLQARFYQPVSGLQSGFGATEAIVADTVDPAGSVDNDRHDFLTDGWYSLTFDATPATAVAIRFDRDAGDPQPFVHYWTREIEVHSVPEPSLDLLLAIGVLALWTRRRISGVGRP